MSNACPSIRPSSIQLEMKTNFEGNLEQLGFMKSSNLIVHYNQVMVPAPVARHRVLSPLFLPQGQRLLPWAPCRPKDDANVDLLEEQGAGNLI